MDVAVLSPLAPAARVERGRPLLATLGPRQPPLKRAGAMGGQTASGSPSKKKMTGKTNTMPIWFVADPMEV